MLKVTDISKLERYGVKGPQAANWLAQQGVTIPEKPNSWVLKNKTLVMRLGGSEFLIEDQEGAKICQKLTAVTTRVAGVYKVPRADAAYLLAGSQVNNLLSELCALDLSEGALAADAVVMTQVASISAIILRQNMDGEVVYRMWCDGTYSTFMHNTLSTVATEII